MKKIIYLLFIVSITASAQNKKLISNSDIIVDGNDVLYKGNEIYFENADKKELPIRINLLCRNNEYKLSKMNAEKLNKMILSSYLSAMYSCKNKYTFTAKEINIFFYDKYEIWSVSTIFTAQNDYGALKDGNSKNFFDREGLKEVDILDYARKEKEGDDSFKKKQEENKFINNVYEN